MRDSVYEFIKSRLSSFSDSGGIYDRELKNICLSLNELLNNVEIDDYCVHINNNMNRIQIKISSLFDHINFDEFKVIDLRYLLKHLDNLQNIGEIGSNRYRDHYIHSIQSFLLLLSILSLTHFINKISKDINIVYKLFSIAIYHDIGYLYNVNDKDIFINNTPNIIVRKKLLELIAKINDEYDLDFENEKELISKVFGITIDDLSQIDKCLIERFWHEVYWYNPIDFFNIDNKNLLVILTDIININNYALDSKDFNKIEKIIPYHGITGATFLYRILETRKSLFCNCLQVNTLNSILEIVIQAVVIHDLKNIESKIGFDTHSLPSFLIIIDELQTYGRMYKSGNLENTPLNPKYVGFIWDNENNKLKLEIDSEYFNSINDNKALDEYNKHSNGNVLTELKKKIKEEDLEFLK